MSPGFAIFPVLGKSVYPTELQVPTMDMKVGFCLHTAYGLELSRMKARHAVGHRHLFYPGWQVHFLGQ